MAGKQILALRMQGFFHTQRGKPVTIDENLAKELNGIMRKVLRLYKNKGIKRLPYNTKNDLPKQVVSDAGKET